jgi:hypothetical protein
MALGLVISAGPSGCVGTGHDSGAGTEITIKTFSNGFPRGGSPVNADLVAIHDGDGEAEWAVVTGIGGVYHATVAGPRYAVAIGCLEGNTNLLLYYQAVSDATELDAAGCSSRDLLHVAVTLTGIGNTEGVRVWIGNATAAGHGTTPVDLEVPRGAADVFAAVGAGPLLYRGPTLDVQADQRLQYDVTTLATPAETHPVTLDGVETGESVSVDSFYATTNGRFRSIAERKFADGNASYITVSAATRQSDDVSTVVASGVRQGATSSSREVASSFVTPGPLTLELPPDWSALPPIMLEGAVPRAKVTFPVTPSRLGTADYEMLVSTVQPPRTLTAVVEQGWIGDQTSVTITTPDLSKLPGWLPEMGLTPNIPVEWINIRVDHSISGPSGDGQLSFSNVSNGEVDPARSAR